MKIRLLLLSVFLVIVGCVYWGYKKKIVFRAGIQLDSYNGIPVYYNTSGNHGRSVAPDGYPIGKKYQCVEFVKRYYYYHYNHKMPNPWGHAINFFNPRLKDGSLNEERNLIQYNQGSKSKPKEGDILVFKSNYGHVAIVSEVTDCEIEIVQQNVFIKTRDNFNLIFKNDLWYVDNDRVKCWLRKYY
jgi:surface antigen